MSGWLQDKIQLLRLWYHENCRVFRDRLVNDEDRGWFDKLLESHMEHWDVTFVEVCPFQPILYGDFMSPGSDVKSYELITSEKKVRGLSETYPSWGPQAQAVCSAANRPACCDKGGGTLTSKAST